MSKRKWPKTPPAMLTSGMVTRVWCHPVNKAKAERLGDRLPTSALVYVTKRVTRNKGNHQRRVYSDGRLYIWVQGLAIYLDAEVSADVISEIANYEAIADLLE